MPASGHRRKPGVPIALPEPEAAFHLLEGLRHVALAASGGSDSMALMRLAHAWAAGLANGPKLSVLTVDHGLRPNAAEEARQVADWTKALGLHHQVLNWAGPKPSTGIQARARKARYDLMAEWCKANAGEVLLTAHTRDDQAETVLMRLGRTLSPASLAGIPLLGQWRGLPVLRPLLGMERQRLRQLLVATGQGWIDDPSNDDPRFERVRMRHQLVELAPSGVTAERLVRLGHACAGADALLERCAGQWIGLWLKEDDAGICFAPLAELETLPSALQQRILGRIVCHYGGGRLKPEPAELLRLCRWLCSGGPPRRTLAGAIAGRRKTSFWVTREAVRIDAEPLIIRDGTRAIWDGRFAIEAPEGSTITPAGDRKPSLNQAVPVYARRAYPVVVVPESAVGRVNVQFLRLSRP